MGGVLAPRTFALFACAVLTPLAGVAYAQSAVVEPLARSAALVLSGWTLPLQVTASDASEVEAPCEAAALELEPAPEAAALAAGVRGAPRAGGAPKRASGAPAALLVDAPTVLRLASTQARPSGRFVAAADGRPAGLLLSGVGALGIGLQDGDVLTEALGITPRSPGQIIGAIIEARAQHARYLTGKLWRRGHSFGITVEQPYGAPKAAVAAPLHTP